MRRILVQAGHLAPREPGHETETGTAGEIEQTTKVRDALVALLHVDGRFEPLPMPGDLPTGVQCDAAIFLHCDGATPTASGYSFGFPDDPVNRKLANLIGAEYDLLDGAPPRRSDNYTDDEHFYYGFSRTDTPGPEVLFELGFLTNPREARWIKANVDQEAAAIYRAILRYFGLRPRSDKRRLALRTWILNRHAEGMTWPAIKKTANWREYVGLGGK